MGQLHTHTMSGDRRRVFILIIIINAPPDERATHAQQEATGHLHTPLVQILHYTTPLLARHQHSNMYHPCEHATARVPPCSLHLPRHYRSLVAHFHRCNTSTLCSLQLSSYMALSTTSTLPTPFLLNNMALTTFVTQSVITVHCSCFNFAVAYYVHRSRYQFQYQGNAPHLRASSRMSRKTFAARPVSSLHVYRAKHASGWIHRTLFLCYTIRPSGFRVPGSGFRFRFRVSCFGVART
ncbi:hypothetical protein C8R47DRAFT_794563 [Mycena vitilis]|nr:hypothetical protein C8R47DRAFT_794563 [Mycena vitilis]